MILNMIGGAGGGTGKSDIIVTAPTGSVVYIENQDGKRKDTGEKNGVWTFKGCDIGTWTVHASLGEQSATATVEITEEGQLMRYEVTVSYVKIYGIQRDITQSSPEWVRTDDAVGFEAVASVGTQAGHSDFDNCYPWSEITRETLSTGDVMVKIPKFWFKRYREGNIEHIHIADKDADGFKLHPAFSHADIPKDCVYVGAYKTSSNNKSVSGAAPQTWQPRITFRANAKNKGTGWGILDIATISAIQMLMLVEFATNNMQTAIGRGYCDNTSTYAFINTGSCDSVANLTGRPAGTDGLVDVVWRGIEGFWSNAWEFADGVNWNGGTYYVCNDPSKYADDTATGYTELSFKGATNWKYTFITEEGIDTGANEHVMLPAATDSGSESTYSCDACWSDTGWRVFAKGGEYNTTSYCGLFAAYLAFDSSGSYSSFGSRLLYIPQEVAA